MASSLDIYDCLHIYLGSGDNVVFVVDGAAASIARLIGALVMSAILSANATVCN